MYSYAPIGVDVTNVMCNMMLEGAWAHGVVVSNPLSMREAPGSIPGVSIFPNLSSPCFELSLCLSINVSLSLYRLSRVYPSLSLCVSVSLSLSRSLSLSLSLSLCCFVLQFFFLFISLRF